MQRTRRSAVVLTIAVALVASACGSGTPSPKSGPSPSKPRGPANEQVLGAGIARVTHADVPRADLDAFVRAQTEFALKLYKALAATKDTNVAISPESLTTALAMLLAGASGTAATEISNMLGVDDLRGRVPQVVNELMHELESAANDRVTLDEANRIYADPEFQVRAQFVELLAREFGAPMVHIDFAGHPDDARVAINQWVSDRTHGRIPSLFPEGSIDDATALVLVNAVYLNAKWKIAIDKSATKNAPFHRIDGSTVDVSMMHPGKVSGWRGDDYDAAQLPYSGGRLSMTVIVPHDLHAFERALDAQRLDDIVKAAGNGEVDLSLPRFEMHTGGDISDALRQLGMRAVFAGGLDNMSPDPRAQLSNVQHKVFVHVDESGTEAAGATGGAVEITSLPQPLVVDRPFLFVVRDSHTEAVLFLGRVTDPSA